MEAVAKFGIEKIYVAIPSADAKERREILRICNETQCELLNLPGMYQLYRGEVSVSKMKPVQIEELLGRDPIKTNMNEVFQYITGKVVLVTGVGSIGSELARQIAAHNPKHLILFDIYENNAYDIQQELRKKYPNLNLDTIIGSVRDSRKIFQVFEKYQPEIVYHAAAHKHVPLMEDSPCEAIKNNAMGTYKTAYAAMSHGCKRIPHPLSLKLEYINIETFIWSICMNESFYTGKGIGVAILDTGIYPHIDFDSRICAFADFIAHKKVPYDDNGHGTCVAGILAGSGRASMGKYKGMAPGSRIAALKVLDRFGNGNKEDVLQAFRWILQNRERYRIRIVNISVGTTYRTRNDQDVLVQGVERLWDEGLVVVAAAGNQGPKPGSVTAPGCSKKIITVGSSDMLSGKQAVSGRGPTFECVCKPDLVAPGRQIMACTPGAGNLYSMKSGTSMSTPLVSGAIALALEKDPLLSNVEIKMMLRDSCDDMGLPRNQQGWGKFNCRKFMAL